MTGLLNCFVFLCAVTLVFGYMSVRDDVEWFKNGQRNKNRFVTGVVNGIVDVDCSETGDGEDVQGECMSKVECTKSGGKVGGLCSLLGSCCVLEKTCSQTTSSKLSYFVPPKKFQTECALTVNMYSKDVCQIRLDFERFDLAQPTNRTITSNDQIQGYTSFQCHDDFFRVDEVKRNLGFHSLCGKNKGQHIYVPIAQDQQKIILRFQFKNRADPNTNLGAPDWRIKIRQLECRRSGHDQFLNAPSKLMAMYNTLKNKKKSYSDWDLIAPGHCLQYYPNKTGTFESFNYNNGKGCYLGHLNYAVCFKKDVDICGAKFIADGEFQMNYNKKVEDNKCHPKEPASPTVSQDYIWIQGGVSSENVLRDHYCDSDLKKTEVVVKSSNQPFLYVGVRTDGFRANVNEKPDEDDVDDFAEVGFRIKYDLQSGDCQIPF